MIITNIRRQKNGRYAIYADGEYMLSVDQRTLTQSSITRGGETSRRELDELAAAADEQYATDKALTILSYRDHSKEELRRKLTRTVGDEQAEKAARRMEEMGLVNDESYAEKLAEELLDRRLMGADRALFEMTRRGLDRSAAREAIERLDTDPQERIRRFLSKKYPDFLTDEKERRRATAALARNGFRWDDIRQVLREYDEEE
jgi:regulatory protein